MLKGALKLLFSWFTRLAYRWLDKGLCSQYTIHLNNLHWAMTPSLCITWFLTAQKDMHLPITKVIPLEMPKSSRARPENSTTRQQWHIPRRKTMNCTMLCPICSARFMPFSGTIRCAPWTEEHWWRGRRLESVLLNNESCKLCSVTSQNQLRSITRSHTTVDTNMCSCRSGWRQPGEGAIKEGALHNKHRGVSSLKFFWLMRNQGMRILRECQFITVAWALSWSSPKEGFKQNLCNFRGFCPTWWEVWKLRCDR